MPRVTFINEQQILDWCAEFVDAKKYTGYLTCNNELILEPKKSTRPTRYGYLQISSAKEIAKKISGMFGVTFLQIMNYEWDVEKFPGIRA